MRNIETLIEEIKGFSSKYSLDDYKKYKFDDLDRLRISQEELEGLISHYQKIDPSKQVKFDNLDLSHLCLKNLDLTFSTFRNTDLYAVSFTKCNFAECDFYLCDMKHADFSDSDFKGTNFTEVNIRGTNLNNCKFSLVDDSINEHFYPKIVT